MRWVVAGKGHSKNFGTYALADSFRAELLTTARQGQPFDATTGLPLSLLSQQEPERSWWQHACAFIDMKWPYVAPRSRQSIADALATVTPALLAADSSGRPPASALREAMYGWAFNTGRRAAGGPPDHLTRTVAWLERHTLPLAALAAPRVARAALDTLATKLDGTPASPNTIARKRAVLFTALEHAVELGHLEVNPLTRVSWTAPKVAETVDRRVVVNHDQARTLLAAVGTVEPRLVGFLAGMYYAALRPGEATELHQSDLDLPDRDEDWGEIHLTGNNPATARSWTDHGQRAPRPLKHRADRDSRSIPCPPPLTAILRSHLGEFGTTDDGRLFRGRRGGPLPDSVYGRVWQPARRTALTPAEVASPLAARPYDLRHAAVSTWLNAGVPATQVAAWAGHSVHVLLRVYAKCIVGQDNEARRRVGEALARSPAGSDR